MKVKWILLFLLNSYWKSPQEVIYIYKKRLGIEHVVGKKENQKLYSTMYQHPNKRQTNCCDQNSLLKFDLSRIHTHSCISSTKPKTNLNLFYKEIDQTNIILKAVLSIFQTWLIPLTVVALFVPFQVTAGWWVDTPWTGH